VTEARALAAGNPIAEALVERAEPPSTATGSGCSPRRPCATSPPASTSRPGPRCSTAGIAPSRAGPRSQSSASLRWLRSVGR